MSAYKLPFIKGLAAKFLEAGTRCVAVIHAPTAPVTNGRMQGALQRAVTPVPNTNSTEELSGRYGQPPQPRTEYIRFRSASGPLLLNHILIVPSGATMLNGSIVGQTNPLPDLCRLEAWASNVLPALVAPDDSPAQLREALTAAGEFHPLELAKGSIPDSKVLVPLVRPLEKEEDPMGQRVTDFPTLLLTDSIVIRGVFEKLTICIFGTEIPEGPKYALAADRLWATHLDNVRAKLLIGERRHGPAAVRGMGYEAISDTSSEIKPEQSLKQFLQLPETPPSPVLSTVGLKMEEDEPADTGSLANDPIGDVLVGFKALKSEGFSGLTVALGRIFEADDLDWGSAAFERYRDDMIEFGKWAVLPAYVEFAKTRGTTQLCAERLTSRPSESDKAARVVRLFDFEGQNESSKETANGSNSGSQPQRRSNENTPEGGDDDEALSTYWAVPLQNHVSLLDLITRWCVTTERAAYLAMEGGLPLLLTVALRTEVIDFRQLKTAIFVLLNRMVCLSPAIVLSEGVRESLNEVATTISARVSPPAAGGGRVWTVEMQEALNVILRAALFTSAVDELSEIAVEAYKSTELPHATRLLQIRQGVNILESLIERQRSGAEESLEISLNSRLERGRLGRGLCSPYEVSPLLASLFRASDLPNHLCSLVASHTHEGTTTSETLDKSEHKGLWSNIAAEVLRFVRILLFDFIGGCEFISQRSLYDILQAAQAEGLNDLLILFCLRRTRQQAFEEYSGDYWRTLRLLVNLPQAPEAFSAFLASDKAWASRLIRHAATLADGNLHQPDKLAIPIACMGILARSLESHNHSVHVAIWHTLSHQDAATIKALQLAGNIENRAGIRVAEIPHLVKSLRAVQAYARLILAGQSMPTMLAELDRMLRERHLLLNTNLPPAMLKAAGLIDSLEEGRRANDMAVIMGGFEPANGVILPEIYRDVHRAEEVGKIRGTLLVEERDTNVPLGALLSCVWQGLDKCLGYVQSARSNAMRVLVPLGGSEEADEPVPLAVVMSFLDEKSNAGLVEIAIKGLMLVTREIVGSDWEIVEEVENIVSRASETRAATGPLCLRTARVCIRALKELLFSDPISTAPGLRMPMSSGPPANGYKSPSSGPSNQPPGQQTQGQPPTVPHQRQFGFVPSQRTLVNLRLFRVLMASLHRLTMAQDVRLPAEKRAAFEALFDDILDLIFLWHRRGDELTKRWILKVVLNELRGLTPLEVIGMRILETLGTGAFRMLKGAVSGLSFSVVHASHPPPLLPLHLSSFNLAALEATLDTAFFSTVVTLSAPSEVTHLATVFPPVVGEGGQHSPTTENKAYVCCHIPSANFAATDNRHICLTANLREPFSVPVFPTIDSASADLKGDEPAWDAVFDKLTKKVRDHVSIQQWKLIQATTLDFDVLVDFLHRFVIGITDSRSPTLTASMAVLVPALVDADLPLLHMVAERFTMLATRALEKALETRDSGKEDEGSQPESRSPADDLLAVLGRLNKGAYFLSITPQLLGPLFASQPDAVWCGTILRALARGLQLIDRTATDGSLTTLEHLKLPKCRDALFSTLKCLCLLYRSLLVAIKEQRQMTNAFTLLSETRNILIGVLRFTHALACTSDDLLSEEALHAFAEVFELILECLRCPFVKQLMALDMPDHALDGASQAIFADHIPPENSKPFVATFSSVGSIERLVKTIIAFAKRTDVPSGKLPHVTRLIELVVSTLREIANNGSELPAIFVSNLLLGFDAVHPKTASAQAAMTGADLLADGGSNSTDNLRGPGEEILALEIELRPLIARHCQEHTKVLTDTLEDVLSVLASKVRSISTQELEHAQTNVPAHLLWVRPGPIPRTEVYGGLTRSKLVELFAQTCNVALPTVQVSIPIFGDDPKRVWLENPVLVRRLNQPPVRVPSSLGQEGLPLRIEMENYEDAEAVASGETRQKRSVSAKAARYALNDSNAQQVEEAQTPSVAGSAMSAPTHFHQLPPPAVDRLPAGGSIMDDWGAFTSQAAVMSRPMPQMMPQGPPSMGPPLHPPPQMGGHMGMMAPTMPASQPPMPQRPPQMYGMAQEMNAGPPIDMRQPPMQPLTAIPDQFNQWMNIPEFRDFLQAGERVGLPVLDIFRNPGLLHDPDRKQKFLSLLNHHPAISALFHSLGVNL